MKRIIIAAIVGGIVFFIWSAIIHMSPLGMMGFKSLPDEAREALKTTVPNSGLYFFPGVVENPAPGPSGILVYTADGSGGMSPKLLISELLTDLVAAFIAACIISMMPVSYGKRVLVVMLLGVFGWISLTLSFWIWYNFPTAWVLSEAISEVLGWLIAGLVIAKLVPSRPLNYA